MKRYLSVLLCMAMLFSLLPSLSAAAFEGQEIPFVSLSLPEAQFDGTGKLLSSSKVTDLRPVSDTQGVSADAVAWYQNGVPMANPYGNVAPYTYYAAYIRLQAEEGYFFTADTTVIHYNGVNTVHTVSADGRTAYVLSPAVITTCSHIDTEWDTDGSAHWHECSRCYQVFDKAEHSWDEGIANGEELLYSCRVCEATKTESTEKKLLYRAALNAPPAVMRETIAAPTMENEEEFRIVRYQWYKDAVAEENAVSVGEEFEEGDYYLTITVRIRDAQKHYISSGSYISTGGAYQEESCITDPDAGAITSVFSVPVYPTTTAWITLPQVQAGESVSQALKQLEITGTKIKPSLISVLVYENGAFLGLGAFNGLGFFTWSGDDTTFTPGNTYTLIGTATFADWYVDTLYITVEDPKVCADCEVLGGAESLGFRASYLCTAEPAITAVAVSGVPEPVDGKLPKKPALRCEDEDLYTAKLLTWYDGIAPMEETAKFEEGKAYQVAIAVTPKDGADGLNETSAPYLPVTINGQLAVFNSLQENNTFVYTARFACKAGEPHEHNWDEGKLTIPPTETSEGEMTYTCPGCGETKTETVPKSEHIHSYEKTVTASTCTEAGFSTHTCACGNSYQDSETAPLGHDYIGGLCSRCGEKDPNAPCDGGETCPGSSFSDMPIATNWAHEGIDYCVKNGLMNGIGNGLFDPAGQCSRAMIVSILYRLEGSPRVTYTPVFSDVPNGTWYTEGVIWAQAHDIVNGLGNGKFGPNDYITREQLSTILMRYTQYRGDAAAQRADISIFPDAEKVSPWAQDAIRWAVAEGLVSGKSVSGITYLQPQGNATRAECATILMRFCK